MIFSFRCSAFHKLKDSISSVIPEYVFIDISLLERCCSAYDLIAMEVPQSPILCTGRYGNFHTCYPDRKMHFDHAKIYWEEKVFESIGKAHFGMVENRMVQVLYVLDSCSAHDYWALN